MREGNTDSVMDKAQGPLYGAEHTLAWLMLLVAAALGALGLLVGFNVLDFRSGEAGIQIGGNPDMTALPGTFLDGTMLVFAGITAAILAYTLHSTDHHRMMRPSAMGSADRALSSFEHLFAYIVAGGSIALVVIGLLVGYGAFGTDNSQLDGLLWIWTGFGSGILAATLHTVRHHQVAETDEIVAIVTERVRTGGPAIERPEPRTNR
jgi:hypothetical protein